MRLTCCGLLLRPCIAGDGAAPCAAWPLAPSGPAGCALVHFGSLFDPLQLEILTVWNRVPSTVSPLAAIRPRASIRLNKALRERRDGGDG